MDRRSFLTLCSITGAHLFSASARTESTANDPYAGTFAHMFPPMLPAKRLVAAPLPMSASWDEVVTLTAFQGLINRREPRVYFIRDETDRFWLEYYADRYGVAFSEVDDAYDAVARFKDEIRGYVVYDTAMLDSANVATTLGSLEALVPVAENCVARIRKFGLSAKENLVNRWKNRYDAYRWARRNLWPECNKQLLGAACIDRPMWPSDSMWLRDYLVAQRIFTFDLSASQRDRADRKLLETIFEAAEGPGCVLGWRCARCNEHEFVGLAARHDLGVLSAPDVCNLTVHAAIPKHEAPFTQTHKTNVGDVERKVYISFMATDGDALPSMLHLQAGRFKDPEHGQIPFAYGFLPAAIDLMPGVAACNYERKTDNDYFLVPSSGPLYTYPHMMPNARGYLRETRRYMDQCGLRVAYMINWDDDHWWQEMDLPNFLPMLREEIPDCIGFLRGQGESAFERQFTGGGAPYLFTGEGLHRDSDVYTTFRDFIAANPIRPLFIFCMSNHSVSLRKIIDGLNKLNKDAVSAVRMDEFIGLVTKAVEQGLVPADDFYPDKSKLKVLLQEEARAAWPNTMKQISEHAGRAAGSEQEFRAHAKDPMLRAVLDHSATPPSDVVMFDAIWDSMLLTKLALNRRGIYVNNKDRAVDDFMREFRDISGAEVVRELWDIWLSWKSRRVRFSRGCDYAMRLAGLAVTLDRLLG